MMTTMAVCGPFAALALEGTYSFEETWPLVVGSWAGILPLGLFWWWLSPQLPSRQFFDLHASTLVAGLVGFAWSIAIVAYLPRAPFVVQVLLLSFASVMSMAIAGLFNTVPMACLALIVPLNAVALGVAVQIEEPYAAVLELMLAISAIGQISILTVGWQIFTLRQFRVSAASDALASTATGWYIESRATGRHAWSSNLIELFGLEQADGRNPVTLLRPMIVDDDRPHAPEDESKIGKWCYRIRRPIGPVRYLRETAFKTPESTEGAPVILRVFQDVTQSEKTRLALEELNRGKTAFLANISHEVKTPMNGLIGMLRLLNDTGLSQEQREFTDAALDSAAALRGLVEDLLDLTRLESTDISFVRTSYSIRTLVDEKVKRFGSQAEQAGLTLIARVAPDVPPFLLGDPGRLAQILANLISNAIKFTMIGGVTIDVDTITRAKGQFLRIKVADTGVGLSAEERGRLFSPLANADQSYTRRYGDSGIGLIIAGGLVRRMGGEIQVDSEIGQGSVFWIELPLEIAADMPSSTHDRAAPVFTRKLKVLVAEDHPVNQMLLRSILLKWGHEVEVFENGQDLLAAFSRVVPDLIVMDVQMPIMDGLTATKLIRQMPPPFRFVPILGFTADSDESHRAQFLKSGMDACLIKPMDFEIFAAALKDLTAADRQVI
jgi:signal transduction histidine kinase/ActR/RegA family two-component response regulator